MADLPLLTWGLILIGTFLYVGADPCNDDYGNCDPEAGLCWATGRNTHFCSCAAGYRDAGYDDFHYCIDIDECTEDNVCPENARCQNTEGSYKCECGCGYVMDYTGQHCLDATQITDLCEVPRGCYLENPLFANFGFSQFVSFHPAYSSWYLPDNDSPMSVDYAKMADNEGKCQCEPGFVKNTCGYCVDYDECYNDNPCTGFQSTCTNTEGSYYCGCNPGYVLGPCKNRCFRPEQKMDENCGNIRDLNSLSQHGIALEDSNAPIPLTNWRVCAEGVETGNTTMEEYDTSGDKNIDLILTWVCSMTSRGQEISTLIKVATDKAKWEPWSCWTACKATCWGGLQTRVRKCLNGLPGLKGCPGEGSQKRECYKGEKCPFRVRRDANTLKKNEIEDLMQAMKKYKDDKSAKGFFNAAAAHGWPDQCDGRPCCPHGAKVKFLAWHRSILLNYEEGLSRYLRDKTLGLPYWNWLANNKNPPDLAMSERLYGDPNPFVNMTVRLDLTDEGYKTIQRDDDIFTRALDQAHRLWMEIALKLIAPNTMLQFAEALESAHNGPHVSVCGRGRMSTRCRLSMSNLEYAGFDPLFFMHHTQVDRLWAVAQKKLEEKGQSTWSAQIALEPLDDPSDFGKRHEPFANRTLNSFPIVQAVNTMRDAYYYEELTGVKYDFLGKNGLPLKPGAAGKALDLREDLAENLFIAHYLQSVEENVYVNYYILMFEEDTPCTELDDFLHIASTTLVGTKMEYRNSVPRLLSVVEKLGRSNLDQDLPVKACYTSIPDCVSRCKEANINEITRLENMPTPGLVHYIPNQPIDVYKFQWGAGLRAPQWYVNLDARTQWIYFYGDRASNVVQVNDYRHWKNCNATNAIEVPCSTSACLLQSGRYMFIDKDEKHCKAGLKMLVVSRK